MSFYLFIKTYDAFVLCTYTRIDVPTRIVLVRTRIGGWQNNCFANDFRSPPLGGVKTM